MYLIHLQDLFYNIQEDRLNQRDYVGRNPAVEGRGAAASGPKRPNILFRPEASYYDL